MVKKSLYHSIISEATGVTDENILSDLEEIMRDDIFHSTLDWQSRDQLKVAAKQAMKIKIVLDGPIKVKEVADKEGKKPRRRLGRLPSYAFANQRHQRPTGTLLFPYPPRAAKGGAAPTTEVLLEQFHVDVVSTDKVTPRQTKLAVEVVEDLLNTMRSSVLQPSARIRSNNEGIEVRISK